MPRWCAPSTEFSPKRTARARALRRILFCVPLCILPAALRAQDLAPASAPAAAAPSVASTAGVAGLDLNHASRAALESLDGLGPALVGRLLKARQQRPFADWQDLERRVSGLGPRLMARLSEQGLRIEGQAWSSRRSDGR